MHGQCNSRPTVTFPASEHHRPLAGTKLYCLVTEAHGCEQLAQGCYLVVERLGIEPATCRTPVRRRNCYATKPHIPVWSTCLSAGVFMIQRHNYNWNDRTRWMLPWDSVFAVLGSTLLSSSVQLLTAYQKQQVRGVWIMIQCWHSPLTLQTAVHWLCLNLS